MRSRSSEPSLAPAITTRRPGGLLLAQMLRHGVEQVAVGALALGGEIARPAAAEVDHCEAVGRAVGGGERREVAALALGEQLGEHALAEEQLVGRERRGRGRRPSRARPRAARAGRRSARRSVASRASIASSATGRSSPSSQAQVVENVDQALVEQRQPVLHAGERPPAETEFEQRVAGRPRRSA